MIYVFLITNDVEYLFMLLFTIFTFSLVKCLSRSLTLFLFVLSYGLKVSITLKFTTPNVTVFGGRAFGRWIASHEVLTVELSLWASCPYKKRKKEHAVRKWLSTDQEAGPHQTPIYGHLGSGLQGQFQINVSFPFTQSMVFCYNSGS